MLNQDHTIEPSLPPFGARRFGRVNWLGLQTLIIRETRRFLAVWQQTLSAPLMNAGLFLLIFAIAIGPHRPDVMGHPFMAFLAPGILMMSVIQNAFANSSSSMTGAKMQGNIVDTLMPPLSAGEIVTGYVTGGVLRGLAVGLVIALGVGLILGIWPEHTFWALFFVLTGASFMAGLGLIAGMHAQKFDQMAAVSNFIVTPLTFLSGTFYSVEALPVPLQVVSHINPFFYMIDGVRFGYLGASDASPWLGAAVALLANGVVIMLCLSLMRRGYRLKA